MKLEKLGINLDSLAGPDLSQGYEVWRGDGFDGAPIVAILTNLVKPSKNRKTGEMAQVYILRRDIKPIEAAQSGADAAVCGGCPLRPITAKATGGAGCYVNLGWLTRLWESWKRGNYPRISPAQAGDIVTKLGLPVRQGAYGDPAFVETAVWTDLDRGRGTSYSHQWRTADAALARFTMASVQSLAEAAEAQAAGWRTYRVDLEGVGPQRGEITCPEELRRGSDSPVQCADCGLCNGNRGGGKNITITPIESKKAKARRMAALAIAA